MRILVADSLVPEALDLLRSQHAVDVRTGLPAAELAAVVGEYDALVVRSRTKVTKEIIARAKGLKLVARAGIGVDNIDVEAATARGIMVVNAPSESVVAVAEHTMALLLALARRVPQADASVRGGEWARGKFEGVELTGKTLGVVGLGKIGSEVAKKALAFGMAVVGYDPLITPERAEDLGVDLLPLDELLRRADFISVHVPALATTQRMIGTRELALVKPGLRIVNCARGGVIDEEALLKALAEGRVAGAGLDVFAQEPPTDPRLLADPRVVLTPHVAGSTVESRNKIGVAVAREVLAVLAGQPPTNPVNLPALSTREWQRLRPYLSLAERLGIIARELLGRETESRVLPAPAAGQLREVAFEVQGEMADRPREVLANAVLKGLLSTGGNGPINLVNSRPTASARGLVLRESRVAVEEQEETTLRLRLQTTAGAVELLGDVTRGVPQVLQVNDYWLAFPAQGILLFSEHREGPGVLGTVGTMLGGAGLSISFVQLGRKARGGEGLMVLGLDDNLPLAIADQLRALPSVIWLREVALPSE
ncbi:MAG: phosphoglycerate dehydrogenase [Chloroflexota bacterium]